MTSRTFQEESGCASRVPGNRLSHCKALQAFQRHSPRRLSRLQLSRLASEHHLPCEQHLLFLIEIILLPGSSRLVCSHGEQLSASSLCYPLLSHHGWPRHLARGITYRSTVLFLYCVSRYTTLAQPIPRPRRRSSWSRTSKCSQLNCLS